MGFQYHSTWMELVLIKLFYNLSKYLKFVILKMPTFGKGWYFRCQKLGKPNELMRFATIVFALLITIEGL